MGGINVNMANYYMLHVWVLDDMTFEPDVYAGMIPCIAAAPRSTTRWIPATSAGTVGWGRCSTSRPSPIPGRPPVPPTRPTTTTGVP